MKAPSASLPSSAMAQVDISAIATFSSTPEATLSQLLQKPTTDLVRAFLESITPKAIEHKRLKTQNAKTEIELEATTRSGEAKRKQLETQRDRGLAEIDRLRTSLQTSGKTTLIHVQLASN